MLSVLDYLFGVQPDRPPVQIVALPELAPVRYHGDPEPFHPSAEELAYDLAYDLGRRGESPRTPWPASLPVMVAHKKGLRAGEEARGIDQARELGHALGYSGSGISEPPAGLSPAERDAYRKGFAAGELDFEEDREFEAWVLSEESDRVEDAFGPDVAIADADAWPLGCVS